MEHAISVSLYDTDPSEIRFACSGGLQARKVRVTAKTIGKEKKWESYIDP
jgi:hypothetical protein